MQNIKVMSFNMLFGAYEGTNFSLEKRKEKIIDVIHRESPDIIGCQEVTDSTKNWLCGKLGGEYALIGVGRNSNCRGEGCPVIYRKDKFALLSYETFWLSDSPLTPGSVAKGTDQSPCPRLAHMLHLKSYETGKSLVFLNTHLDHEGELARKFELELIAKRLKNIPDGIACVITGDFNLTPDTGYFRDFLDELAPTGLADATENLGGTFHNFDRLDKPIKIDYILTNAHVISSYKTEDEHKGGVWYSDHYAVNCTVEI